VAETIIPAFKGKLFDSMSKRVTRHSIEQRLMEFELPKPASDQIYANIPDDAMLSPHQGAMEIFGLQQSDTLSWREFRNQVSLSRRAGRLVGAACDRTSSHQRGLTRAPHR